MRFEQRTLEKTAVCTGVGLHSGKMVNMTIHPAPVNHGIKFRRVDLPGTPDVTAQFNRVVDTSLATVIGSAGCIVSTIEHLMATFAGLSIDNALVELDSYEVPVMDGSAGPFTELIKGKITCSIDFKHPLIQKQSYSIDVTDEVFDTQISKARTFGFLQEVEYLKRYGLAQGGSLDNAVVIDNDRIINEDGLRYPDEFVRHKILDCLGDFSLLGMPILGHLVVHKSGHQFNHAFLEKFFSQKASWETCAVSKECQVPASQSKSLAI
jgi:UDP-3-O-[3-hydroxymyristoyl] N-acetylglucosamine deacetylase